MNKRLLHLLTLMLVVAAQLAVVVPTAHGAPSAARLSEIAETSEITAGTVTNCSNDSDFDAKLAGGGTMNFNCGVATITVNSTKVIAVDTVIDGGNQITISGGDTRQIFYVSPGVTLTLRNITVADGFNNGDGGAIYAEGNTTLVIRSTLFRGNRTTTNGSGGAIITYGTASILDSRFEDNSGANGGALYVRWGNATATIENTTFEDNYTISETDGWGGAILVWDGAQATVRDSHFVGNIANEGGAIYNTVGNVGSSLIIERSRFAENHANLSGGAIYNESALEVTAVAFEQNEAGIFGAGITNDGGSLEGDLTRFNGNKILDLEDDAYGGGILNKSRYAGQEVVAAGKVKLTRSTLAGNVARFGGGIYSDFDTEVELDSVTLSGHSTANGSGLYTRGASKISSSTFSNNSASVSGGAIYKEYGSLDMSFTTLVNNDSGGNSSIFLSDNGGINSTFVGTLVDGHCTGAAPTSAGFNLESSASCGFNQASDKSNSAPQVGPLADNGGATLTHLPGAGSPAINAGGENCPASDQRGFLRPAEAACDIGSVEAAAPPLEATPFPTPPEGPPVGVTPEPVVTPQPPAGAPPIVHADLPNGIAPTITVAPQQGRAGESVNISGKSPTGFSQVRIVSMLDGQTMGTIVVDAAANGDYSLQFAIPANARPGPIELCATVTGAANADFACAPFQINAPPPAPVTGSLPPGVLATNAQIELRNAAGVALYSAAIKANGTYNLGNVAAGIYKVGVVGTVSKPVIGSVVKIDPVSPFVPNLVAANPCLAVVASQSAGGVYANPSRTSLVSKQSASTALTGGSALTSLLGGGTPIFDAKSRPMGIYVSGVQNNVTFEVAPQASGSIQRVIIEFINQDFKRVGNPVQLNAPPYRTTFNVGQLAPSRGTRHPKIKVTSVVNGREECPDYFEIEVIANPFQVTGVQPNSMMWDAASGVYKIQGIVPHIPGILPSSFQFPPPPAPALPYLGRFNNRLNAGIQVVGTLNLEGFAHIQAIRTVTDVYLMNKQLLPASWQITLLKPNLRLPITDIREAAFPFGPYPLVPDVYLNTPFLEVPVISFFGLIDVTVNAGAGIGAGVSISGYVKPFKPAVGATLTATGRAHAELGVGIRLLAGLARAGATGRLDAELNIPFTVRLDPVPDAEIDACLTFRFSVRAYVSALWGLASKDQTKEVAKWSGCVSDVSAAGQDSFLEEEPSTPEIIASPVIAIGTNGTQVSAMIENTAAAGATPQVQVVARLRFASDADWGASVALSNPAFSADSPVVALVGPDQLPMVAWAEKKLTFAQASQLGDDMNAVLQRQEIVYRLYRNGQWEPAVYLTDDMLGDGLPALAGGADGAVLAWTRDIDGNWLTRADQRIAVTTFDLNTSTFAPFALLSGGAAGLNGDVRVAFDGVHHRPYVVWVYDADANLNSADDRRLSLAFLNDLDWVLLNPQPLPPRVDSPSITVGPNGVQLAFLVREPDAKNVVGLLGTNGVLWTAHFQNGIWTAAPVLDSESRPIYAEEPALANRGDESLLLFRRFGRVDDNSQYGQIALSRIVGTQIPTEPIYLTDEPRQNWQANLAINPMNGLAAIVRVSRVALVGASVADLSQQVSIAATESVAAVAEVRLNNADDPVSVLSYPDTADPALDPMQVSTLSPAQGESFTISATVRNVGRNLATGITVKLFAGLPGSGTLLKTSNPLPDLPFNATATVAFAVPGNGGEQAFYAELATSGQDGSTANNRAMLAIGKLTAPVMVDVGESEEWLDGLDVLWLAPKDEVVLGYRILRSEKEDGPFDLMGESSVPGFTDVPLPHSRTFCYAVESYNANTVSPRSEPICAALDDNTTYIYLPRLQR